MIDAGTAVRVPRETIVVTDRELMSMPAADLERFRRLQLADANAHAVVWEDRPTRDIRIQIEWDAPTVTTLA